MKENKKFWIDLKTNGYALIKNAMMPDDVTSSRAMIKENLGSFYKTRQHAYSGHLPAFCEYPELAPLKNKILQNQMLNAYFGIGKNEYEEIGLSDITINRSQEWHIDLLRGRYSKYLKTDTCWGDNGGGVYKVLWYLQEGTSLKVLTGQHLKARPLDSDIYSQPIKTDIVDQIKVYPTDLVIMDLRLPHRGSSDEDLLNINTFASSKILITAVIGLSGGELTKAMGLGNQERTKDWMLRNANNINQALPNIK